MVVARQKLDVFSPFYFQEHDLLGSFIRSGIYKKNCFMIKKVL
jgi:hypothetical protein